MLPVKEAHGGIGVPSHVEAGLPTGQADFGTRALSQCSVLALHTVRARFFFFFLT